MTNPYYEKSGKKQLSCRNLPHWNQGSKLYFVTFRLADSIPESALQELVEKRTHWIASKQKPETTEEKERYYKLFNRRLEQWLDDCHGGCVLQTSECSAILTDTLTPFNHERYHLDHWVIMPNHVHALLLAANGRSFHSRHSA